MWPTTNVLHICNIIKAVDSRSFLWRMDELFYKTATAVEFELLHYLFCADIPKDQPQSIRQCKTFSDLAVILFEVNKRRLTVVLLQGVSL